jgi:hypothetical protein
LTAARHPSHAMDFPDVQAIRTYLDGLLARNRDVAVSFVYIRLQTGLSSCRLIRESQVMTEPSKAWHMDHAQKALQVAETAIWRIQMAHPEFDQMMALTERLRFELQDLQAG